MSLARALKRDMINGKIFSTKKSTTSIDPLRESGWHWNRRQTKQGQLVIFSFPLHIYYSFVDDGLQIDDRCKRSGEKKNTDNNRFITSVEENDGSGSFVFLFVQIRR